MKCLASICLPYISLCPDNVLLPIESLVFSQMLALFSVPYVFFHQLINAELIRIIPQLSSMGKVSEMTVMLYLYVIGKKKIGGVKRIDFKENMRNLSFKSVELRHWQAIWVEILRYVSGEDQELRLSHQKR